VIAEHDGYRHLPQRAVHHRCVVWNDGQSLIILDVVAGKGTARISSYVHFHPSAQVDGAAMRIKTGSGVDLRLLPINGSIRWLRGETDPLQGWYSERFGERQPIDVLEMCETVSLPHFFGYIITPDKDMTVSCTRGRNTIRVDTGSRYFTWDIENGTIAV
jgi:hypothetical protein